MNPCLCCKDYASSWKMLSSSSRLIKRQIHALDSLTLWLLCYLITDQPSTGTRSLSIQFWAKPMNTLLLMALSGSSLSKSAITHPFLPVTLNQIILCGMVTLILRVNSGANQWKSPLWVLLT